MTVAAKTQNHDDLLREVVERLAEIDLNADVEIGVDPTMTITSTAGNRQYRAQVKPRVSPSSAAAIQSSARYTLVITPYVSDAIGDIWRRLGIQYVDAAGNMHLRWPGRLHIDVRGRKNPAQSHALGRDKPLRAFKPSGLKALFTLLCEPDAVGAPFREIAHRSLVSLGTVQRVTTELEQAGFVSSAQGSRQLVRTRELFTRWVEAYTLELWPRLTLARFDVENPTWWTSADNDLRAEDALWGGETAASKLMRHVRPGRAIIYARDVPQRLAVRHRFRRADGEGQVEIRKLFWDRKLDQKRPIVPTPLIYADLIASSDPRLIEAAQQLRDHDDLLRRLDRD